MPPPVQWDRAGLPLPAGMRERAFGAEGDCGSNPGSPIPWYLSGISARCLLSILPGSCGGRHTANPTALLSILGRALSSQLVGHKGQV